MTQGVTNLAVRATVEAFAAAPGQQRSFDVLRHCLAGELLLDITGSELKPGPDGTGIGQGSTIRIGGGRGPDGGPALIAFTSQAEAARIHPPGTDVQTMVQPAAAVLELMQSQDDRWLYVDPAGPTCALSRDEVDFALRTPRNDRVRVALDGTREQVAAALHEDGPLLIAVDAPDVPDGVIQHDTEVRIRTTELPDGGVGLLVFTSGPEVVARHPEDAFVTWSTGKVLESLRQGEYGGLVVNPAGPWAAFTAAELIG